MPRLSVRLAVLSVATALPLVLSPVVAPGTAGASSQSSVVPSFGDSTFSHPTRINNTFFPLVPGTQYRYDGFADLGQGLLPHRNVFTVTDLTKEIDGVQTRVVWDVDSSNGQVVEAELAFFAQDDAGNVWALGEYPEEYENGQFAGAPDVWIAGLEGARAGIAMLAHPQVGVDYSQGLAPNIGFADRATVFQMKATDCVPVGCFDGVLITDEYDARDPSGGHQRKYYAPGVGSIQVTPVGGDQETLTLDRLTHLGRTKLAQADHVVRVMDQRGHEESKVYSRTEPVE